MAWPSLAWKVIKVIYKVIFTKLCKYKVSYCGDSGVGWAKPGGVGARSSLRGKKVCWNKREEMDSVL